mgnify:CR=1 FL=1|jgi:hypothetical protein|nr:MAG: hypothetical protein DIU57_03195 [Pseudomonadota bacterium]
MPQLIALVLAGVGLYAGYRWISREIARALADAREEQEELRNQALNGRRMPKDLGNLEWDEAAGVYRPSKPVQ